MHNQRRLPVVYMRGGTSRALIFHLQDLPPVSDNDFSLWNPIFTSAIGSPDPDLRQLDGMGGGISSLSKVAVVGPSSHPDADVDYIFAQVGVDRPTVSYKGNCGNISSAIGPFAVDEGLVRTQGDTALVRIHHKMSGKIIHAHFSLKDGMAAVEGGCRLDGVAGSGAPIRLDFIAPSGSVTGEVFPTGTLCDVLTLAGGRKIRASLVDVANPLVIVTAQEMGVDRATEPSALAADGAKMAQLIDLRQKAAVAMGLARDEDDVRANLPNLPLVALISPPRAGMQLEVKMISADQPHKATPLTGAMALAAAAKIKGTLAYELASTPHAADSFRLGHPAGELGLRADVDDRGVDSVIHSAGVLRTARRLMKGEVYFR